MFPSALLWNQLSPAVTELVLMGGEVWQFIGWFLARRMCSFFFFFRKQASNPNWKSSVESERMCESMRFRVCACLCVTLARCASGTTDELVMLKQNTVSSWWKHYNMNHEACWSEADLLNCMQWKILLYISLLSSQNVIFCNRSVSCATQ